MAKKKRRGMSAAFMRSINPNLHSTKRGQTMARKKRRTSKSRRFGRKGSRSLGWGFLASAALYGAGREKISTLIAPVTSKIPLGTIADEVVLLVAGQQVAKRTSGMVSDLGKAAAIVEASRIGVAIADGSAFSTSNSPSTATASTVVF
jgi:hypothetical protein